MELFKKFLTWSRNELNRSGRGSENSLAENPVEAPGDCFGPEEPVIELTAYLKRVQEKKQLAIEIKPNSKCISLGQQLGRGGFGNVYLGYFQGRQVAVKRLQNLATEKSRAQIPETVILRTIAHPHIPKFYGSYVNGSRQIYLVMELVKGHTLTKICDSNSQESKRVSIWDKLYISWQLWCALAYLHSKSISHIDIKPDNIMVSLDKTAKLVDFGLSRFETDITASRDGSGNGTWVYSAPEKLVVGRESPAKGDTWSLGVSLCEAYAMQYPFLLKDGRKPSEFKDLLPLGFIFKDQPDLATLPVWQAIPNESMRALSKLALEFDYNKRPTARQMEKYAYAHLRQNLSLQAIESIDGVPQHLHRRFNILNLKRKQKELVPRSDWNRSADTVDSGFEARLTPGSSTVSIQEVNADEDSHPLPVNRSKTLPQELYRAQSSESLIDEFEMDDVTTGCCGITKSCFKRNTDSNRRS